LTACGTATFIWLFEKVDIWCVFLPRGGLPSGAVSGYVYDWIRQRQNQSEKNRRQRKKLKKKVKKLTKRSKKGRRKEPSKMVKAIGNVEKRLEEEKKYIHAIK
jgi:ATPase subunit of ABC transporter with duplicated ATPase domains